MTKPEHAGFSVDTHLFRELGALLVGRDSTALVELIKNAYDADAGQVVIRGEGLSRGQGSITVSDDGVGMTFEEFKDGFLRIASRTREQGDRRSLRYGRRYTGAKGVGRLSAHKLAALLGVTSVPDLQAKGLRDATGVDASIDWDMIEKHETLEQASRDVTLTRLAVDGSAPGTVIRLERLRRRWTDRALATFLAELEAFRPPPPLLEPLPEGIAAGPFLFTAPRVRSSLTGKSANSKAPDPGFEIVAEGDFASGDDYWDRVASRANWIIEVEARRRGVTAVIAPTARGPVSGQTQPQRFEWSHPSPKEGPFFDARLLIREGVIGPAKDPVADFTRRVAGVRVYMEGFRVLPYGSPGDDWLDLDRDYARRTRELEIPDQIGAGDPALSEFFKIIPNQGYYGAVFLNSEQAGGLEMVVSREGFLPNESFWTMRGIVRSAIDLSTRVRAAASSRSAHQRSRRGSGGPSAEEDTPASDTATAARVASQLTTARDALAKLRTPTNEPVKETLDDIDAAILAASNGIDALMSSQSTLRILASVGQQLAEFVHETNGMLALARQVASLMNPETGSPSPSALRAARASADQLVRLIDRQASYLVEVLSPDSRRRRSRRQLARSIHSAAQLVSARAENRGISITIDVPGTMDTTPMFGAELTTVFTNLLTNAVKAAGAGGRIRVRGQAERDWSVVRVENTGVAVDPSTGERWFQPFESTTSEADPVLGVGMGLGLTIVRSTLADYGAAVQFVAPGEGYATAVEVRIPRGGRS